MFLLTSALHGRSLDDRDRRLPPDSGRSDLSRPFRTISTDDVFACHGLWRLEATDIYDRQPLSGRGNRIVMAGDFRLHRRRELAERLGIAANEATRMADSALVLHAWERWGEDTVRHLQGAFAFAVFDRDARTVHVAVDHCCRRSAYLAVAEGRIMVGSSIPDLLTRAAIPRDLDVRYLGAFLTEFPGIEEETPYRAIRRVPWATVVRIDADGTVRPRRYWQPDPTRRIRLARDDDYVEAAREMIDRAIADEIPDSGPICATLSSGFDSGVVVGRASQQFPDRRIIGWTLAPEVGAKSLGRAEIDESPAAARHAARWPNVEHRVLRKPPLNSVVWDNPADLFVTTGIPHRNLDNHQLYDGLYRAVRAEGAQAVLNGAGGNMNFSMSGIHALPGLLRGGHVLTAIRELLAINADTTPGWRGPLVGGWRHMIRPSLPDPVRAAWHRARGVRIWPPLSWHSLLSPAVMEREGIERRFTGFGMSCFNQFPQEMRAYLDVGFRAMRWAAADQRAGQRRRHGIDQRSPLWSTELYEFCMAIPLDQYLRNGRTRWLAERVLAGTLPPEAFSGQPRYRQGGDRFAMLRANRGHFIEAAEDAAKSPLASELLDMPRIRRLLDDWPADDAPPAAFNREPAYGRAIPNALHVARFIRWVEGGNA
ncbi:MAG: asparagine synthase-related protein [Pseudomonadota bacterium]|nr:asparagine synthase-related protein [Pseudomonadota bacterium]